MAFASENSAKSLVTSSSISYARKPAECMLARHTSHTRKRTLTRLLERVLVCNLYDTSLIRDGRDESVVYESDRIVFDTTLDNQVSNTSSVSKGRNVASNLVESESEVLAECTGELTLGLVTNDHDGRVGVDGVLGVRDRTPGGFGDGGVNTTTKTFVGGNDDEEFALGRRL